MKRRRHTPEQIVRKLREVERLLGDRLPFAEQPLHLAQLAHDLLRRVPASFHRDVLLRPPSRAKGLSSTVVPFQGVGSQPLLAALEQRVEVRVGARQPDDDGAGLAGPPRPVAMQPHNAVAEDREAACRAPRAPRDRDARRAGSTGRDGGRTRPSSLE